MIPSASTKRMPAVRRRLFWPGMTPPCPSWLNCIVHAYPDRVGPITMTVSVYPGRVVRIVIADKGVGIPDIPRAMEPLFTTGNPEERSGLGFAVMQSFMDKVSVRSAPGRGTRVILTKHLEEKPST